MIHGDGTIQISIKVWGAHFTFHSKGTILPAVHPTCLTDYFRKSMMRFSVTFVFLSSPLSAFHSHGLMQTCTPHRRTSTLAPMPITALKLSESNNDDESTRFVSAVAKRTDLDKGQATKMDERIFGFNKVLIDTVYELICFLYPVKGTERDYARFFVLETVARVPYFAYLSVLHLRETFGERGLGGRMRTHYVSILSLSCMYLV